MKGTGWFVVIPMILRLQERQIWTFARVPHVKGGTQDWRLVSRGHRVEKDHRALSLRALKSLDQGQEPEGTGSGAGSRWHVLSDRPAARCLRIGEVG
jgi:hypothetical protein